MAVFERICNFLQEKNISYRSVHHEPTFTSGESAKARGEDVKIGGKAILMKIDDTFKLFVLSAALKVDSKKIKTQFKAKSIRFASKEELLELTGLVPGSVPPFGNPFLPFELFVDISIQINEKIAFNAGSLTDSIILSTKDYFSIFGGTIFSFT
jgi:Ala-tRNA(Pro) deacylase